jgi:serine-type D-Ala-D-Ala carboxypeptidase (penicillin-binding protein 5/6)
VRLFSRVCIHLAATASATRSMLTAKADTLDSDNDQEIRITAPYSILIEAESGAVLFEKNADDLMHPSSMAKLMTAELVFKVILEGRLTLDDAFTISEYAWRRGGAPSGDSTMYAELHSPVKVNDLLYGMIVCSGNDAAIALAEGMAGTEADFAVRLNERARELGLTKSHFSNSTGFPDAKLRMTSRDLAQLAQHIIRTYPEFNPICGAIEFTWNKITQRNRNPLLSMGIGADGMKTGFTQQGGYGLVGSAVQNGTRLIAVVNGLRTAKERSDEARKLLEWGYRTVEARLQLARAEVSSTDRVLASPR